jgi:hypothetical protein
VVRAPVLGVVLGLRGQWPDQRREPTEAELAGMSTDAVIGPIVAPAVLATAVPATAVGHLDLVVTTVIAPRAPHARRARLVRGVRRGRAAVVHRREPAARREQIVSNAARLAIDPFVQTAALVPMVQAARCAVRHRVATGSIGAFVRIVRIGVLVPGAVSDSSVQIDRPEVTARTVVREGDVPLVGAPVSPGAVRRAPAKGAGTGDPCGRVAMLRGPLALVVRSRLPSNAPRRCVPPGAQRFRRPSPSPPNTSASNGSTKDRFAMQLLRPLNER